nr:MAG TPA: hypothetical protein [Caudoviricetes sp.]
MIYVLKTLVLNGGNILLLILAAQDLRLSFLMLIIMVVEVCY